MILVIGINAFADGAEKEHLISSEPMRLRVQATAKSSE